ncbi:hypothetical protein Tco_0780420 [Tanacetum coccineum]
MQSDHLLTYIKTIPTAREERNLEKFSEGTLLHGRAQQSLWHWIHATKKSNGYETSYNQVDNGKSRDIGLRDRQVNQLINDGVITFQALTKETLVESRECLKFENDDFIRRGHILNAIPDPLLDVYQNYPTARELWKALEVRFFMEDATSNKFIVFKFNYSAGRYLAQNKYAKVIGNLMYAMTCTRPDIAYDVGRLSRHTSSHSKKHWDAVNRVFKYLKKTMDYGLEYNGDPSVLEGYTNASWITDQDDYQSLWHWLHATKKSNGYETLDDGKSRHIGLRYRQVNQLINDGVITVSFLRSSKNLADPFTKGLPRQLFKSQGMGLKPVYK